MELHDVERLNVENEAPAMTASGLASSIPKFKKVSYGRAFNAEYALKDNNIVVHFYPPDVARTSEYWFQEFPVVLSDSAQTYFEAGPPRLQAKYTQEVNSWWFQARGYGHVLEVDRFVLKFLGSLAEALGEAPVR